MQIWDSAGQEKFKSLIPNYIRGSSLVFIVYDVSNRNSFEHLQNWIEFINNIENSNIVIVANKIDLKDKREVSTEEGQKFCEEKGYDYFEVSAKEDLNINDMLFNSVASLPFFHTINTEGDTKEKIVNQLLKENLDSLRYPLSKIEDTSSTPGIVMQNMCNEEQWNHNITNNVETDIINNKKKKCC